MSRTARLLFLLLLSLGAATLLATSGLMAFPATGQAQSARVRPVAAASPDIPFDDGEFESEQQLLALANQSRRAVGVPPLNLDFRTIPGRAHPCSNHASSATALTSISG
jgi:uncharacterized protein YkwD